MKTDAATKNCPLCCLDIPANASKCPHCHHFQSRTVTILYHPASAVVLFSVPMLIFLIAFMGMLDKGEDFQIYKDQITVTDSELDFGNTPSGPTVVVMGTIKNGSSVPWRDIRFHAEFFDAKGKRTDVGQKEEYSYYLGANGTSSFKLSFRREFPESNYASNSVAVIAAKDARSRW